MTCLAWFCSRWFLLFACLILGTGDLERWEVAGGLRRLLRALLSSLQIPILAQVKKMLFTCGSFYSHILSHWNVGYLRGEMFPLKCYILFFILSSLSELTTAWKSLAQSKAAVSVLLSDSVWQPFRENFKMKYSQQYLILMMMTMMNLFQTHLTYIRCLMWCAFFPYSCGT